MTFCSTLVGDNATRSDCLPCCQLCNCAMQGSHPHSEIDKGKRHTILNQGTRTQKFREMFAMPAFQSRGPEYYESQHSRPSLFDRHCKEILAVFSKNRKNRDSRQTYLTVFSVEMWKTLSVSEKARHSLSDCKKCARNYTESKQAFPGPKFTLSPSDAAIRTFISEEKQQMKQQSQQKRQQHLWSWTLNSSYKSEFWRIIYNSPTEITKHNSKKWQLIQKEIRKRKHQRECHDMINEHLKEHDALFVLAEGQSLSSYKRMR